MKEKSKVQGVLFSFEKFEKEFLEECTAHKLHLKKVGPQVWLSSGTPSMVWAQHAWPQFETHDFQSISEAHKFLKTKNLRWASKSLTEHRRATLIQEGLNPFKPEKPFGEFLLTSKNTLLYTEKSSALRPFELYEAPSDLVENAPSKAIGKIWEAFERFQITLTKEDLVLDLGACPGGWSDFLSRTEAQVIAIDGAPLDERLKNRKNLTYFKGDAFHEKWKKDLNPTWVFSDVIAYPEKSLELWKAWRAHPAQPGLLMQFKFKGETNFEIQRELEKDPTVIVKHLCTHKHEFCAYRPRSL